MNRRNVYGAEKRDEVKRKIVGMSSKQIQELSTQINIPFGTLTRWTSEARRAIAKANKYREADIGKQYATFEISKEAIERAGGPKIEQRHEPEYIGVDLPSLAAKEARRTQIKELLINLIKEL